MAMSFSCCFKWDFIIGNEVASTAIKWLSEESGILLLFLLICSAVVNGNGMGAPHGHGQAVVNNHVGVLEGISVCPQPLFKRENNFKHNGNNYLFSNHLISDRVMMRFPSRTTCLNAVV